MARRLCEACCINLAEVVNDGDDLTQPYRVCHDCNHRLEMLSLRPLEWFNLAAVHGTYKYLLHDDFYSDYGKAEQPKEKVVSAELFPAPKLKQVKDDLERLMDYTMTLYSLDRHRNVVNALRQHGAASVLTVLERRVEQSNNVEIIGRSYEVCAKVCGKISESWVREQWVDYPPETFYSLAEATQACLPFEEGFARVSNALEGLPVTELAARCYALACFRSPRTLDWMETHEKLMLDDAWGTVAALSHFTWRRAEKWMAKGRPLSLRALQAITSCCLYDTVLLKKARPKLEEQAPINDMIDVLDDYLGQDPVPNVRRRVEAIKNCWQA